MTRKKGVAWLIGCCAVGILVVLSRRIGFNWRILWHQLRQVNLLHIAAGLALIWGTYWLRSVRWAHLCSSLKQVQALDLLGSQFVGFAAVALFGRLADLVRPYLLARRTGLTVSSQVAVYAIERMFDLGAAAVVFSATLAFSPRNLEHRDRFVRVGFGSLGASLLLALFAASVRWKGETLAEFIERWLAKLSSKAASNAKEKILGFREGLQAVSSLRQFGVAAATSLTMWMMIALSYVQVARSFVGTPQLSRLDFTQIVLLMAISLGGSLLQLPIVGWFTQIAVMAAAMHEIYDVPVEAATACGALMLFVTTLSIIPLGFAFAQFEGLNLRTVASETGSAL